MMFDHFPDLYRYRRQELNTQRVVTGISVLGLISVCVIFLGNERLSSGFLETARVFLFLQAIAWVVLAPAQSSSSISSERADRTWDFQRLTPLTSLQTAVGKLLGAPMYAFLMGAFLIPWGFFLTLMTGPEYLLGWFRAEVALIGMAFLSNSVGLLVSANPSVKHGRASMVVGPIIGIAVLAINSGLTIIDASNLPQTKVEFFGAFFDLNSFFLANVYLFGFWAFIGAKWEIGRDYLEQMKPWRLAGFLAFVALYSYGLTAQETFINAVLFLMGVFIVSAALVQPVGETLSLKQWLDRAGSQARNPVASIPVWIVGFASFAVIVLVTSLITRTIVALPLILFFLRDLVLIEASRYLKFKQAKTSATWLVSLLYLVPILLNRVLPRGVTAAFIPVSLTSNWPNFYKGSLPLTGGGSVVTSLDLAINLISAFVQVVIVCLVLRKLSALDHQPENR
jgi:hypothetical protein